MWGHYGIGHRSLNLMGLALGRFLPETAWPPADNFFVDKTVIGPLLAESGLTRPLTNPFIRLCEYLRLKCLEICKILMWEAQVSNN